MMEDVGTELKQRSLLTEKMDMIDKQVTKLEKLIGLTGTSTEATAKTPMVSKFDIYADRLSEFHARLSRCNMEIEKL